MLSENEYQKCLNWLNEKASAPVKYMTNLKILGESTESITMTELWNQVQNDPLSKYIFEKQKMDGSWFTGGPWHSAPGYVQKSGYTAVSPKYVTTIWILKILGGMGYTISNPRVKNAVDWVFSWQLDNGVITEDRRLLGKPSDNNPSNHPCRMNIIMDALSRVSASSDPRFRISIGRLVSWQREDGGWLNEGHKDGSMSPYKVWDRSCPWSSYFALSALYYSDLPEYREAFKQALKFQLWHLEQKPENDVRRVFYHGHEPIQEMIMLSDLKIGLQSPQFNNLLNWLEKMYDPEKSHFKYSVLKHEKFTKKPDRVSQEVMKYRSFHQTEDDWITYHIMRIETNLRKS
ncbi:hypothetical protein FJY84_05225 [Candidatus Bathyarchaeota archaeon]|nr:hypothetical protein [Candidatus Bathyarchaeota archaeon]